MIYLGALFIPLYTLFHFPLRIGSRMNLFCLDGYREFEFGKKLELGFCDFSYAVGNLDGYVVVSAIKSKLFDFGCAVGDGCSEPLELQRSDFCAEATSAGKQKYGHRKIKSLRCLIF